MRGVLRGARLHATALVVVAAAAAHPARAADDGDFFVPSGGEDVVRLDDGRTLRCRVGAKEGAGIPLGFPAGSILAPASRVERVILCRDFDQAPRDEPERQNVARGLVRWAGQWVSPNRAKELRAAYLAAEAKARADRRPVEDWDRHHVVPAGKFVVESDLPLVRVREYADLLQKYLECLRNHIQLPLNWTTTEGSIPVYIFSDREDFESVKEEDGVKGEHTIGYFEPGELAGEGNIVLFDLPMERDETLDVLLHEATHLFMDSAAGSRLVSIRPWLNEGLAEYMGGSTWRYGKFQPGALQEDRLLWFQEMIEDGRVIPLDRLVRTVPWEPEDHEDAERGEFGLDHYAESWCFIHFLLHARQGAYRGALRDYIRTKKFTEGVGYLLLRLERNDFQVIQQQFVEYARGLKLTGGRAYAARALRRAAEGEKKKAEADLAKAVERAGKDAPTLVFAARAARRLGKAAQAAELFRRALEEDPLDAAVRVERAGCTEGAEGLREARLAASLAPEDPDVLGEAADRIRGLAEEGGEGLPGAADLVREAEGLEKRAGVDSRRGRGPGPADVAAAMAAYAAAARGDIEEARGLLRRLPPPENPHAAGLAAATEVLVGNPAGMAERLAAYRRALRAEPAKPPAAGGPGSPEDLATAVGVATGVCFKMEKGAGVVAALDALYAADPPESEQEWVIWAGAHIAEGGRDRAREILDAGLRAFPGSGELARVRGLLPGGGK